MTKAAVDAVSAIGRAIEDLPDMELVALARTDRAAFAILYRRYVVPVHRYCYRRLGDRAAAEDATGTIFLKALASLPGYREGSFRGWLFAIAHHAVVDALRARRPSSSLEAAWAVAAGDPSPEELMLVGEERRTVQEMLAFLTPDQRRVVELRLAGLTGPEIARVLGRTTNAVDVAQHRAIRRLRALLGLEPTTGENHRAGR